MQLVRYDGGNIMPDAWLGRGEDGQDDLGMEYWRMLTADSKFIIP